MHDSMESLVDALIEALTEIAVSTGTDGVQEYAKAVLTENGVWDDN